MRYASAVDIFLICSGMEHEKGQEYCRELEIPMVYHLVMHMCVPKPNTKRYKILVREAGLRNSGLGAHAIQQQTELGEAVAAVDIQEAWRRTMQVSYAK